MSLTPSKMIELGTPAPAFRLPDVVSGRQLSREDARGTAGLLVMFICNHCPFVQHIEAGLTALGRDYQGRGIGIVAISSNDAEAYPEDHPERMRDRARQQHYPFPYLYDADQETAHAYGAVCTPDFFLFDAALQCVYRGQFDGARPKNGITVSGEDMRCAMDCLLDKRPIPGSQKPSMGCNIKWKKQEA